jgi:protein arginine kinase
MKKYNFLEMKDIDDTTKLSLMEQHIISKEFVPNDLGAIITNEDSSIVAMINEEDHLRIQAFEPGFNIDKCYRKLEEFTDKLGEKVEYIKNDKYGYITSCPTNVGSGMRVSVMLHLPALARIGLLNKLLDQAASIGVSVRGLYGENTNSDGYMYQISNQKTLGMSDENIISGIKAIVTSIVEQERKAREVLKDGNIQFEDEIFRAYGILKNARVISEEEALKLLSKVRLGVAIRMIDDIDLKRVQELMVNILTNTLKLLKKQDFSRQEELIARGNYLREVLT